MTPNYIRGYVQVAEKQHCEEELNALTSIDNGSLEVLLGVFQTMFGLQTGGPNSNYLPWTTCVVVVVVYSSNMYIIW